MCVAETDRQTMTMDSTQVQQMIAAGMASYRAEEAQRAQNQRVEQLLQQQDQQAQGYQGRGNGGGKGGGRGFVPGMQWADRSLVECYKCGVMEKEFLENLTKEATDHFMATRFMDDILLVMARNDKWDWTKFTTEFMRSECYRGSKAGRLEPLTRREAVERAFAADEAAPRTPAGRSDRVWVLSLL